MTNAPVADVFVLSATTDSARGFAGLCVFLVDRDAPGLSLGRPLHKMGLRTSPMSELFFDDCRVPSGALLGRPGAGMAVFGSSMEWERACILASTVGTMQRQLERAIAHARERRQFGKPIGKNQAVAHRIVDMKARLETSRLLLRRLGWLMDEGRASPADAALVKLHHSEAFDSMGIVHMVSFLEDAFEIEVPDEEVLPDNFETVRRIAAFVDGRRGA